MFQSYSPSGMYGRDGPARECGPVVFGGEEAGVCVEAAAATSLASCTTFLTSSAVSKSRVVCCGRPTAVMEGELLDKAYHAAQSY